MEEQISCIRKMLLTVNSQYKIHQKYKSAYDRQLAFDFSLFQFFTVGENKVSEILAYFLDAKGNHSQGDLFLNEFVSYLQIDKKFYQQKKITCEKSLTNQRRIDIYIELDDFALCIENKLWADDQPNQLLDYNIYLNQITKGEYLLIYLTPYRKPPDVSSINEKLREELIEQNKIKLLGYKQDIIPLLNQWIAKCEADNITYFLKEFKKYLEVKFLGKNNLNMNKELREIIYQNYDEVQLIIKEYKELEANCIKKIDVLAKNLNQLQYNIPSDINLKREATFNYEGARMYRWELSKEKKRIRVRIQTKDLITSIKIYNKNSSNLITNDNDFFNKEINLEPNDHFEQVFKNKVDLAISILNRS